MSVQDKIEIMEVCARYSHAVCDRRYDDYGRLFAEDGQLIGYDGLRGTGPNAVKEYVRNQHQNWTLKHFNANFLIEVNGDEATSTSDWQVFLREGDQFVLKGVGRYNDTFRRTEHGWKITRRVLTLLGDYVDVDAALA